MPTRILVTGAYGQIGSELTMNLRNIYGASNVIASDIIKAPYKLRESGPVRYIDVTNINNIASIVIEEDIDIIYHLAAILSGKGELNPQKAYNINMNGLYNILEVSRSNNIKKVMVPSSIAAFGPTTPKENTPNETILRPTSIYGVTKVAGELLHEYYTSKYGLDVRALRYPGIVSSETEPGGGTTDYAVDMYVKAVKGECYDCFVREDTTLPFMYMPDALNSIIELADAPLDKLKRRTYNIVAFSCSAKEIEEDIKKHIPSFNVKYNPDYRQEIADSWPKTIDDSKAREEWGWKHNYGLKEMTEDMIKNIKKKFNK
ncbi:MAG: NAD-dependent epimerase/dehydratase family protein [Spirochaetota bacterium]